MTVVKLDNIVVIADLLMDATLCSSIHPIVFCQKLLLPNNLLYYVLIDKKRKSVTCYLLRISLSL